MIIQACLNGSRSTSFHMRLPQATSAIVQDALDCVRAGAGELHIHVYGDVNRESLDPADVDEVLGALRGVLPGTLIGISTGDWIEKNDQRRLDCVARWNLLPDHASVNLSEPGALEVIRALHNQGVGVEAGLSGPADAERLIASGLAPLVLRMLVEVDVQDVDRALKLADETIRVLKQMPSPKPVLLHGFDDTTWPFIALAVTEGYSTRIGFEDTKRLPSGAIASSNVALFNAVTQFHDRLFTV